MKDQDQLKRDAAAAALEHVRQRLGENTVLGIGTGSTANHFIDLLAPISARINATVASSSASA